MASGRSAHSPADASDDIAAVEHLAVAQAKLRKELAKVVVGQHRVIDELTICLLCRGHCILEGVPGLAKTLLISTLARATSLSFSRIQFTPDLMPSDITGTEVIEEDRSSGARQLRFVKGPIFANVILADEINRTPPKTQSALLEAMQEHRVTAAGFTHKLPEPFFVLATQNPIEQEGTYPLPEAQLDRFMFKILVDYPSEEEELEIIRLTTAEHEAEVERVIGGRDLLRLQELVRRVPCADHAARYAMRLTRLTRRGKGTVPKFVEDYLDWGAGPRATQHLVMAAKARAILQGRYYVSTEDIKAVAHPVLRHRLITNFNAEADGKGSNYIVDRLIAEIPADAGDAMDPAMAKRVFAEPNGG
ncbi:MAG TPA: AAA family ATPase [Phycisphaerae bacterium]|nr:AAA family ATPase [Phycisphaerae bacterium]